MTRPNIVRADTLDLQSQDNPTAADHQRHPDHAGLAPHQASQVHSVREERHSEEQALADAWEITADVTDDAGAMEPAHVNGEKAQANGTAHEGDEGGESGESEGDADDDMMDRVSSSPSIDDEDINFEFVYALHTFVATVEGQANATKGDTMVLLDDSNSYWWLVRVVKDSSIGYLPAEHIETPLERLARLNKHRNIDLSAQMLSDTSEKSRNPLRKAVRRRMAKTVQFAAPTYVEASDYDYSSADEEHSTTEQPPTAASVEEPQEVAQQTEPTAAPEVAEAEELASTPTRGSFEREQAATAAPTPLADEPQLSPKLVDKTEAAPLKSRKGTPRNADSFLKDDSLETRKITLTPGLLREDSTSTKPSLDSSRTGSTENLVKQLSPTEQPVKKDVKDKKKDKQRGGMLSGLFKSKKKDKKSKDDLGADSDAEKPSAELMRDSPRASPLPSGSSSPVEKAPPPQVSQAQDSGRLSVQTRPGPTRGKLQKAPPSNSNSPIRELPRGQAFVAELEGSEAAHEMATGQEIKFGEQSSADDKDVSQPPSSSTQINDKDNQPQYAKRAKQRMELDDFSSLASQHSSNAFQGAPHREERGPTSEDEKPGRLSESPVEIISPGSTFMHGTEIVHIPTPGLSDDGEEPAGGEVEDEDEDEEPESLTSSPSIIEHPAEPLERDEEDSETEEDHHDDATPTGPLSPQHPPPEPPVRRREREAEQETPDRGSDASLLSAPPITAPVPTAPTWSDAHLRAWCDDLNEVKDLLVLIHDKSGVVPVSPDHPMMAGLFVEQRKGVQAMMGELDALLGQYLERRQRRKG